MKIIKKPCGKFWKKKFHYIKNRILISVIKNDKDYTNILYYINILHKLIQLSLIFFYKTRNFYKYNVN